MEKLLYLIVSILFAPFGLGNQIRRQYWLKTKGFWAEFKQSMGDSIVIYEETGKDKIEQITIRGFFDKDFPYRPYIYIPINEEWQETMPEWAKWRKSEIVERMKIILPPQKYEYYFEKPDWFREQYNWTNRS